LFFGKDSKVIDGKLRLGGPSKFRKMAESEGDVEGFYLALGQGSFIRVYTRAEWRRLEKKLARLRGREDFDAMWRDFLADVEYSPLDKQGRIVLTRDHFAALGEEAEVSLIGSGDHFEIWPRSRWEAYRDEKVDGHKKLVWKEISKLREGE
jgi:MraZ protein